jgi:hypothetical protein
LKLWPGRPQRNPKQFLSDSARPGRLSPGPAPGPGASTVISKSGAPAADIISQAIVYCRLSGLSRETEFKFSSAELGNLWPAGGSSPTRSEHRSHWHGAWGWAGRRRCGPEPHLDSGTRTLIMIPYDDIITVPSPSDSESRVMIIVMIIVTPVRSRAAAAAPGPRVISGRGSQASSSFIVSDIMCDIS